MEKLLTKKELAAILRVSVRTIDRWRATGLDVGYVVIRGVRRYRAEAVERLLERGRPVPRRRETTLRG